MCAWCSPHSSPIRTVMCAWCSPHSSPTYKWKARVLKVCDALFLLPRVALLFLLPILLPACLRKQPFPHSWSAAVILSCDICRLWKGTNAFSSWAPFRLVSLSWRPTPFLEIRPEWWLWTGHTSPWSKKPCLAHKASCSARKLYRAIAFELTIS
jgi:hypothetical protein